MWCHARHGVFSNTGSHAETIWQPNSHFHSICITLSRTEGTLFIQFRDWIDLECYLRYLSTGCLNFWFPSPFYPFQATFFFRKLLGMRGDDLGRLREYECILQTTRATESHAGEDDDYYIPNGQSNMAEFPTGRWRQGLCKPIHGTFMQFTFTLVCMFWNMIDLVFIANWWCAFLCLFLVAWLVVCINLEV